MTNSVLLQVTWEVASLNALFFDKNSGYYEPGLTKVYEILYCGSSLLVFKTQLEESVGKKDPHLYILERIAEKQGDQSPSDTVRKSREALSVIALCGAPYCHSSLQ